MTLLSVPRVHRGLLQTRSAHGIQSESAPVRSLPPLWCGRHLLFLFLLRLLKSLSSRALAPETLLGPQYPLLGEASGHSTGGSAFTASPKLPMRCLEPEVLRRHCPVDYVHFSPLHPLRPVPHFRIISPGMFEPLNSNLATERILRPVLLVT